MNALILHGSARRGGNTDMLADYLIQGIKETSQVSEEHFYPIDMSISHCRACLRCAEGNGCVIHDDMQEVYPALKRADVVVLATPMFWGYMTSQLKALFDRLEAVVSDAYFGSKHFVLLIGYRQYYGSIIEWLERIADFSGSRCHALACQTYDPDTGKDVPVRDTPHRLAEAFALGKSVAASIDPKC